MNLRFVEDVKEDNLVATVAEMVQALDHGLRIREEVAKEHDQALAADHGGQLMQALGDVGGPGRLEVGKHGENRSELRAFASGRQAGLDAAIECDQANWVLLMDHQIAQ